MKSLTVKSGAKINIGLNIIRKRDDGFHDLETVFYPVSLYDTITFKRSDDFVFRTADSKLNGSDNLIIRAKQKIDSLIGDELPVYIELEKKIPIGGGLGGGSSNAAAVLKGLNKFFNLGLSEKILFDTALQLGSDVPFFISGRPCFAYGRGEKLDPIDFSIKYPVLIVNPQIMVSTKWAFENIKPSVPCFSLREIILSKEPEEFRHYIENDFEKIVFHTYPEIELIKELLYSSGAFYAAMSGSGSTVYGFFNEYELAEKAMADIDDNYLKFIHYEKN